MNELLSANRLSSYGGPCLSPSPMRFSLKRAAVLRGDKTCVFLQISYRRCYFGDRHAPSRP